MPTSPINREMEILAIEVSSDGKVLDSTLSILSISINREVNKVGTAQICFFLENEEEDNTFGLSAQSDFNPGKVIEIKLGYDSDSASVFKGVILNHSIVAKPRKGLTMEINCSENSVKMTLGRQNKYFKDQQDSAIISSIISDSGLSASVDSTTYTHQQLIQYHATNWDFILTRAEQNGLLVYMADDKVCVKKPEVSASPTLELTYGLDVISFSGAVDARDQLPSATCQSWDMDNLALLEATSAEPSVNSQGNLTGKKMSEIMGLSEFGMQTGGLVEKDCMKNWADARLLISRLSRIRGTVTFMGNETVQLNSLIGLKNFGDRFNGKALITGIQHEVVEGLWTTTVIFGLSPNLFYSDREVDSPNAAGMLPAIQGLQNGTVKQIDSDPDGKSRILVDVPMIAASGDGIWARLSNFYASAEVGAFFMPEVGDEVVLGFLNNDPRYAVILGMLYGGKKSPPYTADSENKIKALVTKSKMKIEFDDDQKILTLETPGGHQAIFSDKDQKVTLKDSNGNTLEMSSNGIDINSAAAINIKASSSCKITASQAINVESSGGDVSIKGLNVNAKGQMAFSAQGSASAELKASGNTTIKGAMVMIN
ncbi:MAG: type VI secretion system tip protein VgrG [Bacteroidota bacterium]